MLLIRKTWLATTIFTAASTAIWLAVIGWAAALKQLVPTLLLTPLIWWFVVGRHPKPGLWSGILGGALTSFVTQSARDVPSLWRLFLNRNAGNGEDQAMAIAAAGVYIMIGACATFVGAFLGFVTVAIQRRADGTGASRVSDPRL